MSDTEHELRIISVSATVSPDANEETLAKTVQRELRNSDTFGDAVEFGTVDIYQHNAHSGAVEEADR